jgi:hypothetical protein
MMDGGKYAGSHRPTPERIVASVFVLLWIVIAFYLGSHPLVIRATLLFMIPLSFIWLPDVMTGLADVAVSGFTLRLVGWFVILSVPAVWFFFQKCQTRAETFRAMRRKIPLDLIYRSRRSTPFSAGFAN